MNRTREMEIVAIIPARAGSKGVVDKNIKRLAGKPLLAFSIAAARQTPGIQRVIVSTDSRRYAEIAREFGAEVPFMRPEEISGDRADDYQFVRHAFDRLALQEGYKPDYMVHLRPTTPLRDPAIIQAAILKILADGHATALRSVQEMPESAYKTFEIDHECLKCICSGSFDIEKTNQGRQAYAKTYQANGYVDIIRRALVFKEARIHGDRVIAFPTPVVTEVDTPDDFHYLEYQVDRHPAVVRRLFEEETNGR